MNNPKIPLIQFPTNPAHRIMGQPPPPIPKGTVLKLRLKRVKYMKRGIMCQGNIIRILEKPLAVFEGPFQQGWGIIWDRKGEWGVFNDWARSVGSFGAHPGTPVPHALLSMILLALLFDHFLDPFLA